MKTKNGMVQEVDSGNAIVDMFFEMGASRGKQEESLNEMIKKAFNEDADLAMRALFYNRDVREGQGERRTFRTMFRWVVNNMPETAEKNLGLIPKFGRWDDLIEVTRDTELESNAFEIIENALQDKDGLCAKWMPREGKAGHEDFKKLRDYMGLTSKEYRKLVAGLSDTVEDKMCENDWDEIEYGKVPSQASNIYSDAFDRHDEDRYNEFLDDALDENSTKSVNAGAIFPHEILKPLINNGYDVWRSIRRNTVSDSKYKQIQAQWNSLPNWMKSQDENHNILPVCDVSASMKTAYSGGDVVPMNVSVSLSLYISERNQGMFSGRIATFDSNPTFLKFDPTADLRSRVQNLMNAPWGGSTDVVKVFQMMLEFASENSVPNTNLPDTVLILSDMQFDECANLTGFEAIKREFEVRGYDAPNIVFWNLDDHAGSPVDFHESGAALVSGFSPSILKNILSGSGLTPMTVVKNTLITDRYDEIRV